MNKVPVLFLIFNRPETTRKVLAAIREYRPERLFIAADGPRRDRPEEREHCLLAREAALRIDWPCEINTRLLPENLGCRNAVSSAVSWFFDAVDEGIVLEDDCLPSSDFFRFASAMLEHYRNEPRIMHISGVNFQDGIMRGDASAFYSTIPHIWGWASWKRAWKHYDPDMRDYPQLRDTGELYRALPGTPYLRWVLLRMMERTYLRSPHFNTWDVQWHYTLARLRALAVTPNANLVSNIGGTGTHLVADELCARRFDPLPEKLIYPPKPDGPDREADLSTLEKIYAGNWRPHLRYFLEKLCPPLRNL